MATGSLPLIRSSARRVAQDVSVEDRIDAVAALHECRGRRSPIISAWTAHAIWSGFALLAMALSLLS